MKKLMTKALIVSTLSFSSPILFAADDAEGEFRLGAGITELNEYDTQYTTFEIGYDVDRIFGLTADYSLIDEDDAPDRFTFEAELGYEFGDDFRIKPYLTGGLVHMFGGDSVGNSWATVGLGLRASYKMLYINAGLDYFPKNSSNSTSDGTSDTIWTWTGHETASILIGIKF